MNEKIFHTYIKTFRYHPFERLFDKSIKGFVKDSFTDENSTLYAIVRTKRVEFITESFYPISNYCVVGQVKCGEKVYSVMFNVAKTWYYSESDVSIRLKNRFKTFDEFTKHFMDQYGNPEKPEISNSDKYMSLASIDLEQSTSKSLFVDCPIARAMNTGKSMCAELPIYQVLNMFDVDCMESLDICYIGKSTASTFDRLRKHEKWGPIMAQKRDDEDYLVYFFEIADNEISRDHNGLINYVRRDRNNLPKDALVRLCEASLINFYKPEFNDEYVDTELANSGLYHKWLKGNGYTKVVTEVELEGLLGRLGTNHRSFSTRQEITIDL
ncbi:hypothetical protein M3914_003354 [Vibrio metschnikovii]|nr:hypothetical protein [Vibrio metschnikovii]EKO3612143.1 hypothetical protein [Vibrio metschnikovii]EKO3684938.1 hypothetical protein [Vibrio metschnikovii]